MKAMWRAHQQRHTLTELVAVIISTDHTTLKTLQTLKGALRDTHKISAMISYLLCICACHE